MGSSIRASSSHWAAAGSRSGSPKLEPATEVIERYSLSDSVAFMEGMSMPTCTQAFYFIHRISHMDIITEDYMRGKFSCGTVETSQCAIERLLPSMLT